MSSSSLITDPESIMTNRRGELTPEQRSALTSAASASGLLTCGVAAVLTVLVVLAFGKWLEQNEVIGFVIILAIIIVSAIFVGRIVSIPMRRKLVNARAETVRGEVIWRGKNYIPVVSGQPLKPASYCDLPPGQYTFYRLENTNWLLAAERLPDGAQAAVLNTDLAGSSSTFEDVMPGNQRSANFTADQIRRALADTKEASPDALEANRAGHLTFGQRMSILKDALFTGLFGVVALGIGLFVFSRIGGGVEQKDPGGALVAGLFFAGIGLFLLVITIPKLVDWLTGRVMMVTGRARKFTRTTHGRNNRRRTHYYCKIDDQQFSVTPSGYNAILDDVVYRAYFTARGKRLVNLEPDAP